MTLEHTYSASRPIADVGTISPAVAAGITAVYASALMLGAAMIFTVEPMFAKMVLPKLGGSPAVWNTCLVFFQAALLVGYTYAHVLTTRLGLRSQVVVHLGLVALAGLALPVAVSADAAPPGDASPIPWLLWSLTTGLGIPFVVLSATAPLLQKWFVGTNPNVQDPYHLYAASNLGSLGALMAYPLLIEPMWSLGEQSAGWSRWYTIYGAFTLGCALLALSRARRQPSAAVARVGTTEQTVVTWRQRTEWFVLAFVPSSLLLGVTMFLSTDIAAVPLLWTVPLALYLLTFVVAFARRRLVSDTLVDVAVPLTLTALAVATVTDVESTTVLVLVHLLAFAACAMRLHLTLSRRRPGTDRLTEFYLWIAGGGVAGGLLNTFVAPLVLDSVWEYPAALAAACLIHAWSRFGAAGRTLTRRDALLAAVVGGATLLASGAVRAELIQQTAFVCVVGGLALASYVVARRGAGFAVSVVTMLVVMSVMPAASENGVFADRTFFGVHRVRDEPGGRFRRLTHGSTVHGRQHLQPGRELEPTGYYHQTGPIGQVMTQLSGRLEGAHVAVIGLGAGGLAAYSAPGQQWTFYEIDPAVVRIARDPQMFTFLQACGERCRVVVGDGRLSLSRESGTRYDLLIFDAFSSDSVPVHLVTREALRLYADLLAPRGIIAANISNRHLNLRPVLAAVAAEQGFVAMAQLRNPSPEAALDGAVTSEWVVMARSLEDLGPLASDSRWEHLEAPRNFRIWTDDFSNILTVLRR